MAIDVPTNPAAQQAPSSATPSEAADFDARWAAWQAKGAAHDRAVRRKMAVGAPILIIIAAIMYAVLGR